MTADRWDALDALFADAAEAAPAERAALLAACPDADLRAEVEALLAADAHAAAASFGDATIALGELLAELSADIEARSALEADDLAPGTRVGPWTVGEEIGRGGMGTVYRAERSDGGFRQLAALKLVARGMNTDAVVRRFARERRLLAGLDHPGIARVLDGGTAPDGRPYFAMDLVDGQPIVAFADARALSVEARLALFLEVCDAVAYAHRRLVVHRDLKPSNVLVAEDSSGAARVKLLDFGLAKVLGDDEDLDLTRASPRLLTPEYAAPERFGDGEATTGSDVYSLGVLLHELLAGGRPYRLDSRSLAAVEQTVRQAVPVRLSAAVEPAAALARGTTPERLARRLAGDLDQVVLRALRKEPERRYPSVDALADDLRRHLSGLPVHARPDTAAYRMGKFVRRHRRAVAVAAVAVAAVVAGAGAAVYQARIASVARVRAEREVLKASTMISFLESLFAEGTVGLDERTARDVLADGERRADELSADPAVHARVLGLLGGIYRTTGDYGSAERLLRRALAVHERAGADPLMLADARFDLGYLLAFSDQSAEADSLVRLALDERRARLAPSDGPVVFAEIIYASLLKRQRRYADAERHYRAALAGAEAMATSEERDAHASSALSGLADVLPHLGRSADADRLARRALALTLRRYGAQSDAAADAWMTYGQVVLRRGETARALAALRRGRALFAAHFPPHHPRRASADAQLGEALAEAGRPAEAVPLFDEALAAARAQGQPHDIARFLVQKGRVLHALGRSAEALPLIHEALRLQRGEPDAAPEGIAEAEAALAALSR